MESPSSPASIPPPRSRRKPAATGFLSYIKSFVFGESDSDFELEPSLRSAPVALDFNTPSRPVDHDDDVQKDAAMEDDEVVIVEPPKLRSLGLDPLPPSPQFRVTPPPARFGLGAEKTDTSSRIVSSTPSIAGSAVKRVVNTDAVIKYKGKMIATMTEAEVAEHLRILGVRPMGSREHMQELLARAAKVFFLIPRDYPIPSSKKLTFFNNKTRPCTKPPGSWMTWRSYVSL